MNACEKFEKSKRKINEVIIHCSATPADMDIGAKEIRKWHKKDKGWSDIGYHLVIRRDGEVELGRSIHRMGAHVKGHNYGSIGVCLIGGVDNRMMPENNYTDNQWRALRNVLRLLRFDYPDVGISGHNEYTKMKACPCFDVKKSLVDGELKDV